MFQQFTGVTVGEWQLRLYPAGGYDVQTMGAMGWTPVDDDYISHLPGETRSIFDAILVSRGKLPIND